MLVGVEEVTEGVTADGGNENREGASLMVMGALDVKAVAEGNDAVVDAAVEGEEDPICT